MKFAAFASAVFLACLVAGVISIVGLGEPVTVYGKAFGSWESFGVFALLGVVLGVIFALPFVLSVVLFRRNPTATRSFFLGLGFAAVSFALLFGFSSFFGAIPLPWVVIGTLTCAAAAPLFSPLSVVPASANWAGSAQRD